MNGPLLKHDESEHEVVKALEDLVPLVPLTREEESENSNMDDSDTIFTTFVQTSVTEENGYNEASIHDGNINLAYTDARPNTPPKKVHFNDDTIKNEGIESCESNEEDREVAVSTKKINHKTGEVKFYRAITPPRPWQSNTLCQVLQPRSVSPLTWASGALCHSRQGTPESGHSSISANIDENDRNDEGVQPEVIHRNMLWCQVFMWAANTHRVNAKIQLRSDKAHRREVGQAIMEMSRICIGLADLQAVHGTGTAEWDTTSLL